jgi:transcription antitermination factor NusG
LHGVFSHWQVLFLKPRTEKKVAEVCRSHGLPHYLPLQTTVRTYQRRRVAFTRPLFPGYLFAAFTPEQKLLLLRTNHLVRILTPPRPVRMLRDLVQVRRALRIDPSLQPVQALTRGRRVRIVTGPFQGMEGTVTRLANAMRVVLTVDSIGMGVTVSAEIGQVEPL